MIIESKNIFIENLITWIIVVGTLFSVIMIFYVNLRDAEKISDDLNVLSNWWNDKFLVWWNKHKENK